MSNSRRLRRPDPWDRAPCGCACRVQGDTFVYRPCAPGCPLWQYTVAKAAQLGKPLRTVLAPELN
jgi:hypothetical protein